MQPLNTPAVSANQRPQAARGRWIWLLSGTLTIAVIGCFGSWAIVRASDTPGDQWPETALPTRTVTVTQPVSALKVQSYGAPIKVSTVPGGPVRIAESVTYGTASAPTVTDTVSHGLLTLAAPACAKADCSVSFAVTVPASVKVTANSSGGPVTVAGTGATDIDSGGGPVEAAGIGGPLSVNAEGGQVIVGNVAGVASLDSGGGPVSATGITGKLTVHAEGGEVTVSRAPTASIDSGGGPVSVASISGPLSVSAEGGSVTVTGAAATQIDSGGGPVTADTISGPLGVSAEGGGVDANDVTGSLTVDTGGGPLTATSITSPSATARGEGGGITLGFASAPTAVRVDTGGGDASVSVPGGPYAVTTDSGGSPQSILIPTNPAAANTISITTDGGNLEIGPA